MEGFYNANGKSIVKEIIKTICEHKDVLSEIDGAIGDGDHGINMNKGFSICGERLEGVKISFSEALALLGNVLLTEIGGSMGPIYGTMFLEMAEACTRREFIDICVFSEMLCAAEDGLCGLVDARTGDKTLMDVLLPCAAAFRKAKGEGKDFSCALDECIAAAKAGRDATVDMVARFGRASRLGERSRGVPDAGAVSCTLILETMSKGVKERLTVNGDG